MGGLISFYTAIKYPKVFGKAGVFSPAFWFNDSLSIYVNALSGDSRTKFYFLSSKQESATQVSDIKKIIDLLNAKGFLPSQLKFEIKEDGEHKEWFWNREFGACSDWLFGNPKR
jgi:alpha-glucosidase